MKTEVSMGWLERPPHPSIAARYHNRKLPLLTEEEVGQTREAQFGTVKWHLSAVGVAEELPESWTATGIPKNWVIV